MPFVNHAGRNILFIHVPRTGGTTVEEWLRSLGDLRLFSYSLPPHSKITPQHLRMNDIEELLGENYFDYAFAFVRNPFERIASEFRLRCKLMREGVWKGTPRFSTWLENQLDAYRKNPFHLDNHLRPQWEFVSSRVRVFRYEDGLHEGLAHVAQEIGVKAPDALGHALSSQDAGVTAAFESADAERVLEVYARDFERFVYPKAVPPALATNAHRAEAPGRQTA
jgi:Sulfotransferase family